jgi:hypothetical protein
MTTAIQYSPQEFNELAIRDMKGLTSEAEADYLRSPDVVLRWRQILIAKRDEGLRHIANRESMLERRMDELGVFDDDDFDSLSDGDLEEFNRYEEELTNKNRSTRQFMSHVEDALADVEILIRSMPQAYDPAEIIEYLLDARDALGEEGFRPSTENAEQARVLLDDALDIISEGMKS